MFGWRSARGRAILVGAAFFLLLTVVAGIAVWQARDMHERHQSLAHRSAVVFALDDARAQGFLASTLGTLSILSEDPTPFFEAYRSTEAVLLQDLGRAQAELAAVGKEDEVLALDRLTSQLNEFLPGVNAILASAATADTDARIQLAQQEMPRVWPVAVGMIGGMEEEAEEQQSRLAAERVGADRAADISLWLLVGSSTAAFVAGAGALALVVVSVVRPLASLRASVRTVASGDLEARAEVCGPEEVASLARDFNQMVLERREAEEALRASEATYRSIFDSANDFVLVHDIETGEVVDVNRRFCEASGYTVEEARQLSVGDFSAGEPYTQERAMQRMMKAAQGEPQLFEWIGKGKDGQLYPAEVYVKRAAIAGKDRLLVVGRDITERRQAEEALRASEERYRELFENANDIVYTHDLSGQFTSVNKAGEQAIGYTREELLRLNIAEVVAPEHLAPAREMIQRKVAGAGPTRYELEIITKDGRRVAVEVSTRVIYEGGRPVSVQGMARDISARRRAEEALRERVRRDPLTGVLNHAAIVEELRGLLSDGGKGTSLAVAMVDVDGLKAVNDTYGHQVGDAVLVTVAGALSRDGAMVGRYGGDEFVGIVPGADRQAAEGYRDAVLDTLAGARVMDPESEASVPVVVSIGLTIYPTEAERIEELIKLADSDMYAAKRQRPVVPTGKVVPWPLTKEHAAKMLGELVPLLTSPGDLNEKLRLVAHRLSVGAGYDGVAFVVLFGPSSEAATSQNAFGLAPDEVIEEWNRENRRVADHPLSPTLERAQRPVILDDPQDDERLTENERKLVRAAGMQSLLVAPMVWRSGMVGHLSVTSKRKGAFGPRDAEFLMAVATQVTAIVRMATLIEELKAASGRLAQAQTETVMLLAAAAEAHDHTTGVHLQNIRAVTEALARELGYSEENARELGVAAVLHDIGKVRVPNSVLASTGALAEEEWELLKHHTTWGGQFLTGRPGFELAAVIARSHHERWDGSGYPDGLTGEAIPEAARIVSVADAFDAMTSGRPYKAARPVGQAVREIVVYSVRQFSPKVVEALVRLHRRKVLSRLRRQAPAEEKAA